jgi:hypothetical protein
VTLTAWRAVHPDLRSSNGFRWPWPGNEATAPLPAGKQFSKGDPCPTFVGDGLCLAKTFKGAASGGIPASTCLEVTYRAEDVLGEDADKIRVSGCHVVDVFDNLALIRSGWFVGANLRSADLRSANLRSADLRYADLRYANLGYANLRSADLGSANLRSADLRSADLRSANLGYANLGYANLAGCSHNQWTRWPHGFDVGRLT